MFHVINKYTYFQAHSLSCCLLCTVYHNYSKTIYLFMPSFQFSVPQFFFHFNQINGILQQILISLKNQFSLYEYTVPQIKGLNYMLY